MVASVQLPSEFAGEFLPVVGGGRIDEVVSSVERRIVFGWAGERTPKITEDYYQRSDTTHEVDPGYIEHSQRSFWFMLLPISSTTKLSRCHSKAMSTWVVLRKVQYRVRSVPATWPEF